MSRFYGVLLLFSGMVFQTACLGAERPEVAEALKHYRHTDYTAAIEVLKPVAKSDAAASALTGRSYYFLGDLSRATANLEQAIALDGSNSSYYVWLGRTYGRRAEVAFPVMAPKYAAKARCNFEKALELNPKDSEATGDLFEFYIQAPGFLGGGFDKAALLADKIAERDPVEGTFAKARLAEERKDYHTAEMMLRHAAEMAPRQPGRLLDLAKFLAKRGRYEESDAVFMKARQFAPQAPRVLFQEASTYIKANRKPEESHDLLMQYIAAHVTPEDPSKQDAQKLLKKVSGS